MSYDWKHEQGAEWDEPKRRIIGGAPAGIFDRRYQDIALGERVPGEWWRLEDDGAVVGYGWMDVVWGDAEILLAVAPEARGSGAGSYILERLAEEAQSRGLNYMYNVIRPTHPEAASLDAWLRARGFGASDDGSLLRAATRAR